MYNSSLNLVIFIITLLLGLNLNNIMCQTNEEIEITTQDKENAVNPTKPVRNCSNGNRYKSSDMCTSECNLIHNNYNLSNSNLTVSGKYKFIIVTLAASEFTISPNGLLTSTLPIPQLTPDLYITDSSNSTAFICYPFDETFLNCKKYKLDKDEYVLSKDSRHISVELHERTYLVGQFYINSKSQAIVCYHESVYEHQELTENVSKWFLVVYLTSAVSLLITFICCMKFPQLNVRRNYNLLCHLAITSVAFWILVIEHFVKQGRNREIVTACIVLELIKQFSFLASFFWINVQAIDLYFRFNNLCTSSVTKIRQRQFIYSSIYAWGCPFVITCITLIVEMTDAPLRPYFKKSCNFDSSVKMIPFIYFYTFVSIILLINFVLFVLTIVKLLNVGKNISNVNKRIYKQLLVLYAKLFFIMGMCWIAEVISWAVSKETTKEHWYFTDTINGLQGFFILIIYLIKPNYVKKICQSTPFFAKWLPGSSKSDRNQSIQFNQTDANTSSSGQLMQTTI